ncbi:hypothetical protein BK675_04235 [Pseudomonas fluorescens]|nr:hypothetical protein BK677_03750 [Pseudomonas fluorescens]ROO11887.1 hypothetical protein BK675_04235 [Pseudomonas fluorescens]ROO20198.1 hypothetical protein BK676_06265 [Pseudomonas fluorescens]
MFYRFSSIELDNCKNSIDVARIEIRALKLEESLLSVQKFGEISAFFKEVRNEDHLATIYNILTKKIETLRKSFELDEKISSEKNTLRISLIFGIIASATLSPELIQPLAKTYGITFGENIDKLVGIGIAFALVMMILKLSHYIFRAANTLKRILIK